MTLIYKLFGLGTLLVVLRTILEKADKKDVAFWLELGGLIIAMLWTAPEIKKLLDTMMRLFNYF